MPLGRPLFAEDWLYYPNSSVTVGQALFLRIELMELNRTNIVGDQGPWLRAECQAPGTQERVVIRREGTGEVTKAMDWRRRRWVESALAGVEAFASWAELEGGTCALDA